VSSLSLSSVVVVVVVGCSGQIVVVVGCCWLLYVSHNVR
jgi:hypothetical protein